MKAVWKKLIAVAFCGATAASMLSVGASAADHWWDLIGYGDRAESQRVEVEYEKEYYGDLYMRLEAKNYKGGKITASLYYPSNVENVKVTFNWKGNNITISNSNGKAVAKDTDTVTITNAGSYSATCTATIEYDVVINKHFTLHRTDEVRASVSGDAYSNADDANRDGNGIEIGSNRPKDYWDHDKWYWYDDGYWYYANGSWHYTTRYPDWDWGYDRPSYSKEYEVDWSDDTFYYNGKVQMPTATVTIGGRTIELDVKLISGDGTSVGRHRVRASLPSRYSRYDITGTTLYYEIEEPEKDGFVTENGNIYYYDNGRKVTGWQTINGSRYYFLDNGEAADGWVKDGPADWYYFSDGKMQTGWINDNGTTYYCYGTGKMCHGRWHEIAGKWYYFNESGAMLTSQWILDKGNWYYVAGDGVMATNTTVPGGYRVNASGVWVK